VNPVIEELLQLVENDPLPVADTSSHWQFHGANTTVERRGDDLILRPSGLGSTATGSRLGRLAQRVERLSLRPATARLRSYAAIWKTAQRLAQDLGVGLTFDMWKQTVALAILHDHWEAQGLSPKTFALIGDGHGFLGALIRRHLPESRIYCIDLPKILVFQASTQNLADPDATLSIMTTKAAAPTAITFVLPQAIEVIADQIDCAVNIASMQEMNYSSIASYFTFLRRRSTQDSRFYCVNRLRKELPGGEVTNFTEYPWLQGDETFIDGRCPYYAHSIGRTLPKGPRILGVRVPFINHHDGPHMHRLVHLAPG
jgi:hypothetical protein